MSNLKKGIYLKATTSLSAVEVQTTGDFGEPNFAWRRP